MDIALATCSNLPDWEVDDAPLHAALDARGIRHHHRVWDDPRVDWSVFDAIVVRTTWDYHLKREAFVGWAMRASTQTTMFNPAQVIAWNSHKSYLRHLEAAGVPIAPTCWLHRRADVASLMAQHDWTRGFIKPMVGATARETLRFDLDELCLAQSHVDRLLDDGEELMLQPYLPDVEAVGELSLIYLGGELSHVVRKVPVAGDYRVQDDFGAHDEPATADPQAILIAGNALKSAWYAPLLYARVDLLQSADGWLLNELELVEPSLFFRHGPLAAGRFADLLAAAGQAPIG
jgi:glutathione synthase/RimK-type ligase-like ATP-grasp enzyme